MKIIGLSGKIGTGKSYVAGILSDLGFRRWGFAWPLKHLVMEKYGFTYEEVFVTKPEKVRAALQREGVHARETYGDDHWIQQTAAWLEIMAREWSNRPVVIDDVRFPNEADWIRAAGGHIVRLEPGNRPRPELSEAARTHISETALDYYNDFDCIIVNDLRTDKAAIVDRLITSGVLPESYLPVVVNPRCTR